MTFEELYQIAHDTLNPRELSRSTTAGTCAAVIETDKGNLYKGVCIDAPCGVGFCAEHSAIAAMVTAGESRVRKLAAVFADGSVAPPCGRCREFLYQVNDENGDCEILVEKGKVLLLKDILPYPWN